jgi:hypothetical protein
MNFDLVQRSWFAYWTVRVTVVEVVIVALAESVPVTVKR